MADGDGVGGSPRELQPSDFETPCEACGGIGTEWTEDRRIRRLCEACGGVGTIPTELTEGIKHVLQQELLRMIEDGSWDAPRPEP